MQQKLDPFLTSYIKVNSMWISDINLRLKTIKLLEENIEVNLCDLGLGSVFLDRTPKHKQKVRLHEIKNFCVASNSNKKVKR